MLYIFLRINIKYFLSWYTDHKYEVEYASSLPVSQAKLAGKLYITLAGSLSRGVMLLCLTAAVGPPLLLCSGQPLANKRSMRAPVCAPLGSLVLLTRCAALASARQVRPSWSNAFTFALY